MEKDMTQQVWFITGASKGFGLEISKAVLAGETKLSQRNPEVVKQALGDNDHLLVLPLDVIDEAQTAAAVDAVLKEFGQIDVLVNNAGRGLVGAIEETSTPEVRSIFAVNVEGILNVSRSAVHAGWSVRQDIEHEFCRWVCLLARLGHLLLNKVCRGRDQRGDACRT